MQRNRDGEGGQTRLRMTRDVIPKVDRPKARTSQDGAPTSTWIYNTRLCCRKGLSLQSSFIGMSRSLCLLEKAGEGPDGECGESGSSILVSVFGEGLQWNGAP